MSSARIRTALIVAGLLVPAGVVGLTLAKRLTSVPAATSSRMGGDPGTAASGKGVKIKFSDKPLPLPAFELKDLATGQPLSAKEFAGKVVLVNFWATWCGPCRAEIPMLVELQERYRDQLIVAGLSIDAGSVENVTRFVRDQKMNYPVAIAGPDVESAFGGISSVPSTFVVDPKGQIVTRHVGLLNPGITEQEVRILSGLPSEAEVEVVKDTGQVLLANAAYATEIPGVELKALTPTQKEAVLSRLNTEKCSCGCGLTLAQCRINDPGCAISLPAAQAIVKELRK